MDDKRLFETAVKGMLDTLDPYTEFEGEQLAKVRPVYVWVHICVYVYAKEGGVGG